MHIAYRLLTNEIPHQFQYCTDSHSELWKVCLFPHSVFKYEHCLTVFLKNLEHLKRIRFN